MKPKIKDHPARALSVKETLELLEFIGKMNDGIIKSAEDKKLTWLDFTNFFPALLAAPKAFQGIREVPGELKLMDEAGKQQLIDAARQYYDLPDDELEQLIEESIGYALGGVQLAIKWINKVRKKKGEPALKSIS